MNLSSTSLIASILIRIILGLTTGTRIFLPLITSPIDPTQSPDAIHYPVALPSEGMLAYFPGDGSSESPGIAAAVAETGAQYKRISLDWGISEPVQGQISYDTPNDMAILTVERAGLRIFPTLYVGKGWMNGYPAGDTRSYPPADLRQTWSNQTGYSPSYYNFVYQFFSHYQGHFDYVAIENEANSLWFWGGSADDYVRLIKTAYKAIKAADPHVIVADSGFVSDALGLAIAGDYLSSGLKSQDWVTQFAEEYYSVPSMPVYIDSFSDLQIALANPAIIEQNRRITTMLDGMKGSVDAVNFHFYQNEQMLPEVVSWLRSRTYRAGYTPMVLTNETGFRATDMSYGQSPEMAKNVFKKMITAMSLGMKATIWFSNDSVDSGADKLGIFNADGSLRPSGATFQRVLATVSTYRYIQNLSSDPVFHHVFIDSNGKASLEAIWSDNGNIAIRLKKPAGASRMIVTDYAGASNTYIVTTNPVNFTITPDPVFIHWE